MSHLVAYCAEPVAYDCAARFWTKEVNRTFDL